jgi:hypothetical protein
MSNKTILIVYLNATGKAKMDEHMRAAAMYFDASAIVEGANV